MAGVFDVTCNTTTSTPMYREYGFEIVNISLSQGEARLKIPLSYNCYNATTKTEDGSFSMGYYMINSWVNNEKNKFACFGCNTLAYFTYNFSSSDYSVGCLSTCLDINSVNNYGQNCSGVGCCQTAIPFGTYGISFNFDDRYNNSNVYSFNPCSYAMLIEDDPRLVFNTSYITSIKPIEQSMPVVFNWVIEEQICKVAKKNKTSYACKSPHNIDECTATQNPCSNPAKCHNIPGSYSCSCPLGWRKIDHHTCQLNLDLIIGSIAGSCAGIVALLFLGSVIYVVIERRNLSKIKEKYFQQNGGWILLENIKSNHGIGFTIFTKQQIEQATNNFDGTNIIGHGGQGIVYKGFLSDQIVAIKKCKIVTESKKKEFGKEMVILSQISHKNILKLLGCCLEVEVPILVYEFISNGTLFQYIHNKKPRSFIPLTTRLRIAYESAEALAYLHTSASPPIFHGDVKSSNILLDQNYTTKVSDFGASILAPTNEEQFVTFVQGTCGYLDPEYMQTCQLKDKSDVYSFGVVLVELLTSKPVIDFDLPEEKRSLSSRFISAMKENKLQEILDNEFKNEDDMKLIEEVAELAMKCLSVKGEERPIMKEVAEELHRIIKLKQHPWEQEHHIEETTTLLNVGSYHDIDIEHSIYYYNVDNEAQDSIALGR